MIVSFAAILLTSGVSALSSPYHLKEFHPVPRGWKEISPAPASHTLELQIALKQHRFSELETALYEVSDPAHARYGQHLSATDVHELVRPADETLELVESWLAEYGVDPLDLDWSPAQDWVSVTLPVNVVESLLDTNYSVYRHEDGAYAVRTPQWSLPVHLHEHIISVQPTNSFFQVAAQRNTIRPVGQLDISEIAAAYSSFDAETLKNPTVEQVCNTSLVTPLCLRTFYGTYDYVPQAIDRNRVALNNFLNETNNRSDIHIFLEQYRPDAVGFSFVNQIINNGSNQQTPDTPLQLENGQDAEGNLDAETIIGITYPTPLFAYNTGGEPPFTPSAGSPTNSNEPYGIWLKYILGQSDDKLPQVVSTSYADEEWTVPYSYATAVCQQFAQLGARGVSLLFASGDGGVGSAGYCYPGDDSSDIQFDPLFPASCPYVTAVGATKNFNPEVVAYDASNGFASGGGYSNYFPRPSYQDSAVTAYTKGLGKEFAGLYNASGRGYPDISAQGQRFATIWNGSLLVLDGTSASTPAAASIISLVNDALLAAGKPPLGFLNPWLYATGHAAFNDITSGSAIGCNTTGFPAKKGWDAVSGWGTPVSVSPFSSSFIKDTFVDWGLK